jgi:sirohydrochlorin cobaltochelatase
LFDLGERIRPLVPDAVVKVAFLEFQSPTLASALAEVVRQGCTRIDVVPVFWASGGHVAGDVLPLLDDLRGRHPHLRLRLLPVLSELPGLLDFVASSVARFKDD